MKYIYLLSIISMNVFIIVSTFLKESLNINIDSLYYKVVLFISLFTILYFIAQIFIYKKINKKVVYLLIIIATISFSYYLSPFNSTELAEKNFVFFLMWSIPASLCGIMVAKSSKYIIDKFFKIIFFVLSTCIINIIIVPYIIGDLPSYINFGLLNYQNVSYITAFIIGIGLYFITDSNIKFKILYLIFICLLLPVIFIAAGRGGAVLLILYILFTTVNIILKRGIPLINKILIIILVAIGSIIFITTAITLDNTGRTFSYITADGLDLNNTSGREDVYEADINFIKNSPILGYGFFNYYHLVNNIPHNIIMEILLISGVIGLLISLGICYFLIKKYIKNFERNSPDRLVGYIFLYPITMLMFSTNFLVVSEFWFVIFYVLAKYKEQSNV